MRIFLNLIFVIAFVDCSSNSKKDETPSDSLQREVLQDTEVSLEQPITILEADSANTLSFYYQLRDLISKNGTEIMSNEAGGEHCHVRVSIVKYKTYKMISWDHGCYDSNDNYERYLFKNDSIVAMHKGNSEEQGQPYIETIHVFINGTAVKNERALVDLGFATDENSVNTQLILDSLAKIPFQRTLVQKQEGDEFESSLNTVLAKFDSRYVHQEQLGEELPDQTLEEALADAKNVTELYLRYQELTEVPLDVLKLPNLVLLNLDGNALTTIPIELKRLSKLTSLELSGNNLINLPIGITTLANLENLNLGDNKLSTLPKEMAKLTRLRDLQLNRNQLAFLPVELCRNTTLENLDLAGNQLTGLPDEIVNLTNLYSLDLSNNKLSSIPSSIGKLADLQVLYLDNNQLKSLPPEVGKLPNLYFLNLADNKFSKDERNRIRSWFKSSDCIIVF